MYFRRISSQSSGTHFNTMFFFSSSKIMCHICSLKKKKLLVIVSVFVNWFLFTLMVTISNIKGEIHSLLSLS